MASPYSLDTGSIQNNIELINEVLRNAPQIDVPYYQSILEELQLQLAQAWQVESSTAEPSCTKGQSQPFGSSSTIADPMQNERKRSREDLEVDFPEAKRLSAQPSPDTPGTPRKMFDSPEVSGSQELTLRGRPSKSTPIVDLTESDPPSPVDYPRPNSDPRPFVDPFPELINAFRDHDALLPPPVNYTYEGLAQPAPETAFNQDFMKHEDLAALMLTPTPAGQGYAFTQQKALEGQADIHGFFNREIPYLPGPEDAPWRGGSDSEDYGEFPLNVNEADAIEKLLENIKEHGETPDDREPTPRIMRSNLKEYQKIGLTWLLKMEAGVSKGGILADEMGLGKTVQALALMCARPSTDPLCKTTLIIAPLALMRQWEKEIEIHIHTRHALRVFLYWGNGKKADFRQLRDYDVVLTTYGTLSSEYKQKESRRETMLHEREMNEPEFFRKAKDKLALLGRECMWYRVILDEAHAVKNRNSKQSKATADIQAIHRLCLTGTPMMNSVDELYPLLRFLRVSPYMDWQQFSHGIAKSVKAPHPGTRKQGMNRLQILLKSIMMRRQKTSLVDGVQICTIPPKHTTIDNVEFSDDELAIYKALEAKSQVQLNKYLERGSVSANYANILVLLLRLRQACCHPHLIKDLSQPATEGIAEDDLLTRAKDLHKEVVERLKAQDSQSFDCPICLEADPNPTIIIPCGHTVCGECVQKLIDPAREEGSEEGSTAKCPHCRGDLKAKLITDYKHFCKVHCPDRLSPTPEGELAPPSESETEDEAEEDSEDDSHGEVDQKGNLAGFVISDDEDENCEFEEATESDIDFAEEAGPSSANRKFKKGKRSKGKEKAKPTITLAQLKKESLRNKAAKRRYIRRLEKTFVSSAKTEKTTEILCSIRDKDSTEKTLVFSQFTSLLDLVEVPLSQKRIRYQRYDGSMKMDERADAVNAFMNDPHENVMLVSLKAGNAGLNLWKASQVIILDPFWNPFVEEQAVDRAHRMPQLREVTVHRVLVPETVEDRICLLQDRKREVIGAALDEQASKSLTRLSVRELGFLFGLSNA